VPGSIQADSLAYKISSVFESTLTAEYADVAQRVANPAELMVEMVT